MTSHRDQSWTWETLLERPSLVLARGFVDSEQANSLLDELDRELPWQRPSLRLYGRTHLIPRQQVWMGDEGIRYRYSGQTFTSEPWHPAIAFLARRIKDCLTTRYLPKGLQDSQAIKQMNVNSVLINRYTDGNERMGWHRDDEPELGPDPVIASVSLGAERPLRFRFRDRSRPSFNIWLPHGSLLLMGPGVQHELEHALLPKKSHGLRINLTFRHVFLRQ